MSNPAQYSLDTLDQEVLDRRRTIKTERYAMSIGELTSLYKDQELIVHPEFQRFYRWDEEQKSRLVESILLGIPLPPIFVSTTPGGIWELVDGLQRVSTLLQLQGVLVNQDGQLVEPLVLQGTKYLPSLDGKSWGVGTPGADALSSTIQRDIKRARVDIQIIERDSSSDTKYDLFQRLNSYGSQLTSQELRSCMLVSVDPAFMRWLESLAADENFRATVQLPDRLKSEQYDIELILRFLILHNRPEIRQNDLRGFSNFLDDESIKLAEVHPRDSATLQNIFTETFRILNQKSGEDIFRRWDPERNRPSGSFLNTAYEVFAMGLGYHIANENEYCLDIRQAWEGFWEDATVGKKWATGMSTERRLNRLIPEGRRLLSRQ